MKTKARGLKKAFAVIMALAVVLSYSMVPTFAAGTGTVTVKGIKEDNATVTAYKIVEDKNGDGHWTSVYKKADGKDAINPEKPTSQDVIDLAKRTDLVASGTLTKSGTDYTADLGPGMYLILVTNSNAVKDVKVYNPMIVSVNYGANNTFDGGTVDANKDFGKKADGSSVEVGNGSVAYAKSDEPTIDKVVKRGNGVTDSNIANGSVTNENNKGDTAGSVTDAQGNSIGDKVWFHIDTAIPAYAGNYTNPVFKITDTLSSGLKLNAEGFTVKVDGTAVTAGDSTWTFESGGSTGASGFVIKFAEDYIKSKTTKDVEVEYSATIQKDCAYNYEAETNTAKITYSNSPSETKDSTEKTTYHYTFTINGLINGSGSNENKEVIKVGYDEDSGEQVLAYTEEKDNYEEEIVGAKFNLYKASQMKADNSAPADDQKDKPYRTGVSEAGGVIKGFDRLDAGVYYIVETEVKKPYSVNSHPVKVEITAELFNDGQLKGYTVKFDGKIQSSYTREKVGDTITTVNGSDIADINNYHAGTLPSTGGMGTVLFTVAGIALMAIAAGLFMASRRRNAEEE